MPADANAGGRLMMLGPRVPEILTTPPTTLAGVIATLNHASRRSDEEGNGDHAYVHLAEAAQYIGNDIVAAGAQLPAMIAAALRQINS
jgi:hypothetical protein